jgi:hypothetical protein
MNRDEIKHEVDKNIEKLATLRDEVKVRLHLASLDAKKEWDDKLAPRVADMEQSAKNITEASRGTMKELIARVEEFLVHLRSDLHRDKDKADTEPRSN